MNTEIIIHQTEDGLTKIQNREELKELVSKLQDKITK
jgi:hypothetical protein